MVYSPDQFSRMEMDLLRYHFPRPSVGMGGATTYEAKTVELQQVVRDLDLKGREAMIQRAYSKFVKEGLMARSGFGYKMTDKGIQVVRVFKKLHTSM